MKIFFRKFLLWSLFILLIPLLLTVKNLPRITGTFIHDNTWSGVLRIWTCSGAHFGASNLTPWLNSRAAVFERQHSGVRVQFSEISPEVISSFINAPFPPDAVIFTPGTISSAAHLIPLSPPQDLHPSLIACGLAEGKTKALPIAMDGYFWVCSDSALKSPPGSPDSPSGYRLCSPIDSPNSSYSAALLALFSGSIPSAPESFCPGAELGLPTVSSTVSPDQKSIPLQKPASFSKEFRTAHARSLFISEEVDAYIATAQDIRRLEQLSSNGKAPEYSVYPGATAFTDQFAMAAVVDHTAPDSVQRERLCAEFISYLFTEESQSALKNVYAFRVTGGEPLYTSSRTGMAEAEASLSGSLIVPNAFDTVWRERAAQAAALFTETDAEASDLFHTIFP